MVPMRASVRKRDIGDVLTSSELDKCMMCLGRDMQFTRGFEEERAKRSSSSREPVANEVKLTCSQINVIGLQRRLERSITIFLSRPLFCHRSWKASVLITRMPISRSQNTALPRLRAIIVNTIVFRWTAPSRTRTSHIPRRIQLLAHHPQSHQTFIPRSRFLNVVDHDFVSGTDNGVQVIFIIICAQVTSRLSSPRIQAPSDKIRPVLAWY